jgi:hypothetical protein
MYFECADGFYKPLAHIVAIATAVTGLALTGSKPFKKATRPAPTRLTNRGF